MLKFIHLFLICIVGLFAFAQDSSLAGFIYNSQTNKPALTISIRLQPGNLHAVSDSTGHYTFSHLPPGNFRVHIEGKGLHPLDQQIAIEANSNTRLDFYLRPSIETLEEFVVTGQSGKNKISPLPYIATRF